MTAGVQMDIEDNGVDVFSKWQSAVSEPRLLFA